MRKAVFFLAGVLGFAATVAYPAEEKGAKSVLDFKMKNIDGGEVNLSKYKGDVLLIVNVASECGYTPQYAGLQELHEKYQDQGLRVLGFPANNFGAQEPGTDAEIKTFCTTNYNVGFNMFSKVSVKGEDQCDLYAYLTDETKTGEHGGEVKWNFEKFLVDREGKVVGRFRSKVKPESEELVASVEKALAEK